MKTPKKQTAENYIKEIRRNTRRIFFIGTENPNRYGSFTS